MQKHKGGVSSITALRLRSLLMSINGFLLNPPWNLQQHESTTLPFRQTNYRFKRSQSRSQERRTPLWVLPSAGAGGEDLDEVVGGHVEERVEVKAAVAELAERPLLRLRARGHLRVNIDVRLGPRNIDPALRERHGRVTR